MSDFGLALLLAVERLFPAPAKCRHGLTLPEAGAPEGTIMELHVWTNGHAQTFNLEDSDLGRDPADVAADVVNLMPRSPS